MSTAIRFSVEQYDQKLASGLLTNSGANRRLELIQGEIRELSPIGPRHEELVARITDWTYDQTPRSFVRVRVQSSVGIPEDDSAPEPDVIWAKARDYSGQRPSASEVLLLIEVADSSLEFDLDVKGPLYAAAGIVEYWVVDVSRQRVHIFRNPAESGYASHRIADGSEKISPTAHSSAVLDLAWLFGQD